MILLHATDAPYDIPGINIRRGETMYHLLSDQAGGVGTAELLAFIRACGGQDAWMQAAGTYREHFDIFGEWADRARELGATTASGREIGQVLARKRQALALADVGIPVPAITSRQMRVVEDLLITTLGIDPRQTLELAGARLVEFARHYLGGTLLGKRLVILAGPGNTGSVGFVAARHVRNSGATVAVIIATEHTRLTAINGSFLASLEAMGIAPRSGVAPELAELAQADLIIDALTGMDSYRTPHGPVAVCIERANTAGKPVLAVDLPSGLDPDEGGPATPCMVATATMTMGLPKRGLTLDVAQAYIGDLWLADIGVPPRLLKRVSARVGPIFAGAPLVRLTRRPLAGDHLPSTIWQWVAPAVD